MLQSKPQLGINIAKYLKLKLVNNSRGRAEGGQISRLGLSHCWGTSQTISPNAVSAGRPRGPIVSYANVSDLKPLNILLAAPDCIRREDRSCRHDRDQQEDRERMTLMRSVDTVY
jgi:hypothetical protein